MRRALVPERTATTIQPEPDCQRTLPAMAPLSCEGCSHPLLLGPQHSVLTSGRSLRGLCPALLRGADRSALPRTASSGGASGYQRGRCRRCTRYVSRTTYETVPTTNAPNVGSETSGLGCERNGSSVSRRRCLVLQPDSRARNCTWGSGRLASSPWLSTRSGKDFDLAVKSMGKASRLDAVGSGWHTGRRALSRPPLDMG